MISFIPTSYKITQVNAFFGTHSNCAQHSCKTNYSSYRYTGHQKLSTHQNHVLLTVKASRNKSIIYANSGDTTRATWKPWSHFPNHKSVSYDMRNTCHGKNGNEYLNPTSMVPWAQQLSWLTGPIQGKCTQKQHQLCTVPPDGKEEPQQLRKYPSLFSCPLEVQGNILHIHYWPRDKPDPPGIRRYKAQDQWSSREYCQTGRQGLNQYKLC